MTLNGRTIIWLTGAMLAILGSQNDALSEGVFVAFEELAAPAGPGAREPNLFVADDGRTYLSWLEPDSGGRFAVRFSLATPEGWSAARTITSGDDLFVNWADFPSLVAFADGRLAAHWLARNSDKGYAYDVKIALSTDGGLTWAEPVVPHRDRTQTQHGFVSLLPLASGDLSVSWLDGRHYQATDAFAAAEETASDVMALRHATLAPDGTLSEEQVLDDRTCTCCQTSAVRTPDGLLVAYRDRSKDEIRDIGIVRLGPDERRAEPSLVHPDGWQIAGCPVNGPAIAADGERVAVAWLTAADGVARVQVAFSSDGGRSFDPPVRVDQDFPLGRVDLVLLADGSAVVSWLEYGAAGEELLIRRISPKGELEPVTVLVVTREGRTSGFPRMARADDRLYLAWTQALEGGADPSDERLAVRTAVIRLGPT